MTVDGSIRQLLFNTVNGKISTQTSKLVQILGNLNNAFKLNLVQKISIIEVYNALVPPSFYKETKFGPSVKRVKDDWQQP